jgi:hypothetical protein
MTSTRIAVVVITLTVAGCSGAPSASAPSAPSSGQPAAPSPVVTPVGATGPQPTITGVFPNVVSTAGTWGAIRGAQFEPGATVMIAGSAIFSVVGDSTTIRFSNSGAHAPGAVDITVTNPGGMAATLAHGYTYASADSFDPNGEWIAHADGSNHYLTDMRFSIRNNLLITLSCGTPVTMPTTVSVANGGFSFAGADGLTISGTLDSTTTSEGRVQAPGCGDGLWWADKVANQ